MYLQCILKRSFLLSDFNLFPTFWIKNLYLQLNHPVGVLKEFTRGKIYWAKIMAEVKTREEHKHLMKSCGNQGIRKEGLALSMLGKTYGRKAFSSAWWTSTFTQSSLSFWRSTTPSLVKFGLMVISWQKNAGLSLRELPAKQYSVSAVLPEYIYLF